MKKSHIRNKTEKKICKCCNEEKFLCSFSRKDICRKCSVEGNNLSLEMIFPGSEERKLIPAIKEDLAFLKQRALEVGINK